MNVFYNFIWNLRDIFWKKNLFWHLLAFFLTYIIVVSDLDWTYYQATRSTSLRALAFPAVTFGGIAPLIVPLILYVFARINNNYKAKVVSVAVGQAAILGILVSGFYKALTGRVPPELAHGAPLLSNISHNFQFGFFRGGVFWGWPSTHTTMAFAMSVSLFTLFPHKKITRILVMIYASYIGLGISVTIHWFSEFVAGAIIGSVVGVVVGKSFKKFLSTPAPLSK